MKIIIHLNNVIKQRITLNGLFVCEGLSKLGANISTFILLQVSHNEK